IPVNVLAEGTTTVFCDKLVNVVSALPTKEIELTLCEEQLVITPPNKKISFQLRTLSHESFPCFPQNEGGVSLAVPTSDLRNMINHTVFAVSEDSTRHFINGVHVDFQYGNIICVSTDGKRLAYIEKKGESSPQSFSGVIVPTKILGIVNRKLTPEGSVTLCITSQHVYFFFGGYKFSSVLIEGQFPNYKRVIPDHQERSFCVGRVELMEALKRVSLLVEQKSHRIFITIQQGLLTLSSKAHTQENEIGDAQEEIACAYTGESEVIALNYLYLEEPLKVFTSKEVQVEFTDPAKALTLRAVPNTDCFHIIMPMQTE
ncbi:DNA polymerase III subunit beta, partial [Treponema pallidum]